MDAGFGGQGKEGPAGVKLTRCDESAISSTRPFGLAHIVGLAFAAYGLYIAVNGCVMIFHPYTYSRPGGFAVLAFGLVFALLGYVALAPWTLHMDVAMHTYRECWGCWPLCKVTEGSWEDFDRLALRTYFSRGNGTTLRLHLRDAKRQPLALHSSNQEEAQRQGLAVASLLNLPLAGQKLEHY